jgi:hypothetical protein
MHMVPIKEYKPFLFTNIRLGWYFFQGTSSVYVTEFFLKTVIDFHSKELNFFAQNVFRPIFVLMIPLK